MAGRLLLIGELNDDLTELRITLEALGLTVELAPDGLAGLEKGREFQPDLVVTEILTNRLTGFELASRIKSGAAGFAASVIFYTEFYRDEKARRDVLAKYGAVEYLVRPFQKEALKKSVAAHFKEFLSSLPPVPAAGVAELAKRTAEASPVVPQLGRAVVAVEKQPASQVSGSPVQPGKPGGSFREVPARFRAFNTAAPETTGEATQPEQNTAATAREQPGIQLAGVSETTSAPRAEPAAASSQPSQPFEPARLLPVEQPSSVGRLLQSTPVRIAAAVVVAALALYLARDQFRPGGKDAAARSESSSPAQPSPTTLTAVDPTAPLASPPTRAASGVPARQESPPVAESSAVAEPISSSTAEVSEKNHSAIRSGTAGSRPKTREHSSAVSIQDVTGAGRGPALRKMKPIQLSSEVMSRLASKPVVVRVVIDNAGRVTEVTPVNQEGVAASLPEDALATIQEWEFSRSRRKDPGQAVKYFSLRVQNSRQ
jgi:CheY-like chemotaxis protein